MFQRFTLGRGKSGTKFAIVVTLVRLLNFDIIDKR